MMQITVAKADPIDPSEPTPDTHIHITDKLPRLEGRPTVLAIYYQQQAEAIELALYESLPGGTYDRLLGHMLARKASHLRVAHGREED